MKLYNTLTRKVEEFIPNEKGIVKLYTCGPTVYHFAHIGNLRTYLQEDILDEEDDGIIVLRTDNGEEIEFVEIASINIDERYFLILQPVEKVEGLDDDEAIAFEVVTDENGDDKFNIVTDDDLLTKIFKEYNKLLDEAENA